MKTQYDVLIVGGGFYGLYIAEHFALLGFSVVLCEQEKDLMTRASYVNQARVHNGYHYPRSVLTALRSRISFPRFAQEFDDCIDTSFDKYYMIGKILGKVTAQQFQAFCKRIGSPCERAPERIQKLTNPKLIEDSYLTTEWAFDSVILKKLMLKRVENANVTLLTGTTVKKITAFKESLIVQVQQQEGLMQEFQVKQVFNCSYSSINQLNQHSSLAVIPLKHEMTEMCLVDVPDEVKGNAFTIMCGPFFSVMPFPSSPYYSFSHVRYTPHYEWYDQHTKLTPDMQQSLLTEHKQSAWSKMRQDAMRYLPILGACDYQKSLWEIKTVLPASEVDDSRPILFKQDYHLKGYHCIMGGKIDNVYDVITLISNRGLDQHES